MNKVIKSIPDGLEASYADELPTDLSEGTRTSDSIEIQSSTGQNYVMPSATETQAGLMSADDKARVNIGYAAWGGITGDINNQPDLTTYVESKAYPDVAINHLLDLKSAKYNVMEATKILSSNRYAPGDGLREAGTNQRDIVYGSRQYPAGDYAPDRQYARYAVECDRSLGDITITVQFDINNAQPESIQALASENDDLWSGLTVIDMTDNGGGNYTYTLSASTTPTYNRVGFKINFKPNGGTAREYMVIKDFSVEQNNVILMSRDTMVNNIPLSLLFPATNNATSAFNHRISNTNFISLSTGCISGSTIKYMYVHPNGTSLGEGTIASPVDIITAFSNSKSGIENFILGGEEYDISDYGNVHNYVYRPGSNQSLIGLNPVYIKTGKDFIYTDMTDEGSGVRSFIYDYSVNARHSEISDGSEPPRLVFEKYINDYAEVSTLSECQSAEKTFYWDLTNTKMYIHFHTPMNVTIPSFIYVIQDTADLENITIVNINTKRTFFGHTILSNAKNVKLYNCNAESTFIGNTFNFSNSDVDLISCKATYSENDGFGFENGGESNIIECIGNYCKDNGISHHDGCVGYIQGGEYSYNGSDHGNVAPAFGANVTCFRVKSTNSYSGFQLSVSDDKTVGRYIECITDATEVAYKNVSPLGECIIKDPVYGSNTVDIESTGDGKVIALNGLTTKIVGNIRFVE